MTKRILILTADTGMGHRSAANAIRAELEELHSPDCSVDIVNPMDHHSASLLLRNSQADYDRMVREMPDLYRFGYKALSDPLPNNLIESAFTVMLFEAMYDILKQYQPDVIVDTYESYLAPLDAVFTITRRRVPLFTIVTDLATLHPAWFNDTTDVCCVPTQVAHDLAIKNGLSPHKLKITGLPINPLFAGEYHSKSVLREELGWQSDMITLLAVGSTRVNYLPETLNVLNHSGLPLQLIVVCGGSESLLQHFSTVEWHAANQVYNYVDNMPAMMHAADAVIGKAGGLFVSEALACGLPLVLIDLIQGQETGNVDFAVQSGAGEFAHNPVETLEIVFHWLDKGATLLAERTRHEKEAGHPRAAYEIADLVWHAAEHGITRKRKRTIGVPSLANLTDLLTRFNVPWHEGKGSKAVIEPNDDSVE